MWPLLAGLCRMVIAVGGGGLALYFTGSLQWLFGFLAVALVVYGATLAVAVKSGVWFRTKPPMVCAATPVGEAASAPPCLGLAARAEA